MTAKGKQVDNNDLLEGLAEMESTVETTSKKERKMQTAEDRDLLVAGVEKIREMGVSENFAKVLSIVTEWNGSDEEIATGKKAVIEAFGGSEQLKDYVDGEFQEELKGFVGLVKAVPVLNNFKSFYARRERAAGTVKVKTTQIVIQGKMYSVSTEFLASCAGMERTEKIAALLGHSATKVADITEL